MAPKVQFDEFIITTPWGSLTVRWYGPRQQRPIIAIGKQRNYTKLYQQLTNVKSVTAPTALLCLINEQPINATSTLNTEPEEPTLQSTLHWIRLLLYVMEQYKWPQVSLLVANPLSAILNYAFATLFAEHVDQLIFMRNGRAHTLNPQQQQAQLMKTFESLLLSLENLNVTELVKWMSLWTNLAFFKRKDLLVSLTQQLSFFNALINEEHFFEELLQRFGSTGRELREFIVEFGEKYRSRALAKIVEEKKEEEKYEELKFEVQLDLKHRSQGPLPNLLALSLDCRTPQIKQDLEHRSVVELPDLLALSMDYGTPKLRAKL